MQTSYIFDATKDVGATGLSYEELQRRREMAQQLASGIGAPRNVGEGLTAVGKALAARGMATQAQKEEGRLRSEADALWSQVSGGGDMNAIVQALNNPLMGPGQKAVLTTRLDRMMNPPKPAARRTQWVGDMGLMDLDTGEIITPAPEAPEDPLEAMRREAEMLELTSEIEKFKGTAEPELDAKAETDLRKEYRGDQGVKDFRDQRAAFERVQASAVRADANPSPAADIALIFNYMKVLDPGSTVREGEFATAAQAGSFGQQIQALITKLNQGEILTPEQRADFVNRAGLLYRGGLSQYRETRDDFRETAGAYGVDIDRAVPNFEPTAPLTSQRPERRPVGVSIASGALTTPQIAAPAAPAAQPIDYRTAPIAILETMDDAQMQALSDEEFEIVRQRIIDAALGKTGGPAQ